MKYSDFSTLVQLGVGLHLGTALLQLYGELGVQPLVRTITRIRSLVADGKEPPPDLLEELNALESSFEIFKIQLFNEYKRYVKINSIVAIILVLLLTVIAYKASDTIPVELTIPIVAISILPAPLTLAALWLDAERIMGPIKVQANKLQACALRMESAAELARRSIDRTSAT